MEKSFLFLIYALLSFTIIYSYQNSEGTVSKKTNDSTSIIVAELFSSDHEIAEFIGNPKIVDSPFGKAVYFNGVNDAIFMNNCPIINFDEFTIEILFKPESGGLAEQRFLHFGEISGDRVMLETRLPNDSSWYFDAFIKSGEANKTLVDSSLIHSLNKWQHAAFVKTKENLITYINGTKEIEAEVQTLPIKTGQTSIGVRQNLKYWFKGAIYKIRITSKALQSKDFFGITK